MKEIVEFKQGFKPKGKVTVQLFDENGKMINEQKSENFIAKPIQKYFDHAMRNIFTRNRATGGHQIYSGIQDPFTTMILTDATHPEDPQNEWIRAGNIIGYAHTTGTYSGSSSLRGSYNLIESFTNREQVHIVVDFPTHAGNGTFQSIYFSSEYTLLSNATDNRIYDESIDKIQKHNGKIYAKWGSSTIVIFDDNFNIVEQTNVGGYSDFWIVGNVIYYTNGGFDITSAPISDPTNRTLVVTLDNRASGITRHELSGRWYLKYSSTIYVYDSNWNLLSSFIDINGTSLTYMAGSFDEGVVTTAGTFIWVGGEYNNNMTTLHGDNRSEYRIVGFFDGYTFYHYYRSASNRATFRIPLINIGSRTLLDQPVIKTANNTMKVIYDFMLPPIS